MKIAIQFAMESELHALPGARDLEPFEVVSGIPFYHVAPKILAACSGIGKVNAAMAAELLCVRYGAACILNPGVAGCATDLPVGTLVVPDEFVQHDMDTTAIGDPVGFVSTVNTVTFPTWAPAHCREILTAHGFSAHGGRAATGDWFATNCERSHRIVANFHPTLLDMEGCAIAQVCLRNGVRFAAVKSVSDHLFFEKQIDEYFDFGQALQKLGEVLLPLAQTLAEED